MNSWLFLSLLLVCVFKTNFAKHNSKVFAPSFFSKTAFISSEELTETEANRQHPPESQSGSVADNSREFTAHHYVVWDDYNCKFYDMDIFYFVDCYMRYFGFKHHGKFVDGHKGLYSKVGRVIKMGAINALIKYFTGCDMLLTNEDDPFEWNRETEVREQKAEDPSPRCQHVRRHRQVQLKVKKGKSLSGAIDIYYEDRDGNSILVRANSTTSYHITITALNKGVMQLSRIGDYQIHFGLQCLLCGDNMDVYEDCEYRKVRYSNYQDFDLRFSNSCAEKSFKESKESALVIESADEESEEVEKLLQKVISGKELPEKSTTEGPTTAEAIVEPTSTSKPTTKIVNTGRLPDFGEKLIRGGSARIQ